MLEKLKTYNKITGFGIIARRYFVNNFYDGMLTILGILLGFFVLIIKNGQTVIDSNLIILPGLGTAISMFISGLSGSYLSERAEQRKIQIEIQKAMARYDPNEVNASNGFIEEETEEEIEKAMITIHLNGQKRRRLSRNPKKDEKRVKTLQEKAERFASIIVSIVNGSAPFLGGIVPIFPFFFVSMAGVSVFVWSFILILIFIVLLGVFLGLVAQDSLIKNILQMLAAFI